MEHILVITMPLRLYWLHRFPVPKKLPLFWPNAEVMPNWGFMLPWPEGKKPLKLLFELNDGKFRLFVCIIWGPWKLVANWLPPNEFPPKFCPKVPANSLNRPKLIGCCCCCFGSELSAFHCAGRVINKPQICKWTSQHHTSPLQNNGVHIYIPGQSVVCPHTILFFRSWRCSNHSCSRHFWSIVPSSVHVFSSSIVPLVMVK